MTDIHTIGDSHSAFSFRGEKEGGLEYIFYQRRDVFLRVPLYVHFVGSQTMYTFGLRGCEKKNFEGVEKGNYLVFCFGEIDVRCHIHNQIHLRGRREEEIIFSLVEGYIRKIKEYEAKYKIRPVVFGVTPPVRELTVDGYPSVGPFEDRVRYTKKINDYLKKKAKEQEILYFDVLEEYSMKDGTFDMSLSDGLMHIGVEFNGLAKQKLCDLLWEDMHS